MVNLVNVAIAVGAGIVSITSPCCLPLLPGYLGYVTGMTAEGSAPNRWRPRAAAGLFVLGFTAVFALLGATASAIGHLLLVNRHGLGQVAGAVIVVVGLVMLLGDRVGILNRGGDWSRRWAHGQLWAAPILGAAFAITWTPCIGPVLAGILTLAGSTEQVGQGVVLLVAYGLGLGVPFVALSFSVHRIGGWLRRLRRTAVAVRMGAALVLIAMGALLITDRWVPLMAPLLRLYAKAQWPPV